MFNPQDIEEKNFEKAFIGGYKTDDVDDFFYSISIDYKKLFLESAEMKKKIGILVEKIEEYRRDEDYIKNAILYSQRLKDDAFKEANAKVDEIINEAAERAEALVKDAETKAGLLEADAEATFETKIKANSELIEKETAALKAIKKEVSEFKVKLQNMYKTHLKQIMSLPSFEEEKPAEEEKAEQSEEISEPEQAEPVKMVEEIKPAAEAVTAETDEKSEDLPEEDEQQVKMEEGKPGKISIALDTQEIPAIDIENPRKKLAIDFKVTSN